VLQCLFGLVVRLGGNHDLHGHQQIALGAVAFVNSPAAGSQHPATLGSCGDLQRYLAVEGRHRDGASERELGELDRHSDRQIIAVAAEQFVSGDMHLDVEVARAGTTAAGFTLFWKPDSLLVLDARWYPDRQGPGATTDPFAAALGAR